MFDLDANIRQWREQFIGDGAFYTSEVEELESHLRDTIDELVGAGLSEEEAFLLAVRRLGDRRILRRAYATSRPLAERILRSQRVALAALLLIVVASAVALLGTYAVADLVAETGTVLIRARDGAAMHVAEGGIHVESGRAGLIDPTVLFVLVGVPFAIITTLALLGWGMFMHSNSALNAR